MKFNYKTILLLIFPSFMSVGWGQNCIDGVEVELWGECYNIEETTTLDLSDSGLNGEIPSEIGNLVNLDRLYLSNNQLSGNIPTELGNLLNLMFFSLRNNQLTGEIPTELGNLLNLEFLWLPDNQLTGKIPSELGGLSKLQVLDLNNNQLSGEIPTVLCDLPSCSIVVQNNNLCSPYPPCIEYTGLGSDIVIGEQDTSNCSTMSITDDLILKTYSLSSPYPNPFNPITTISFSIPQSGIVSLNIYDITGKLVITLINEQLNIGYHSIDWDGTNQSSGMYLVRMESGEYVKTQKLLLVK